MNFSELKTLMSSRGVTTLAEIARTLNTTPQAVSNWKTRNQVPHHIVAKLSQLPPTGNPQTSHGPPIYSLPITNYASPSIYEEDTISLSDILLTIAEQLKIILLIPFVIVFITFTYVKYIKEPLYISRATIILPDANKNNLGGFAGIASQFGVNIPSGVQADLSSPSLFPELIKSRTFAEKILDKKFYVKKFDKDLSLLAILTHGDGEANLSKEILIQKAYGSLGEILRFEHDLISSTFSIITVTMPDPVLAKNLADVVLDELEGLNRFFKIRSVTEKISFIETRIASVQKELLVSEMKYKAFNEKNRQVFSPALKLEEDRLMRDVEVQKGVYLTLKQQLELAKIEEIQGSSVVQILDYPQIPLVPSNIKLKLSLILSLLFGIVFGLFFAFIRGYTVNIDKYERKKIRRFKNYFIKKGKSFLLDPRVTGFVSIMLLIGSPYYFSYRSQNPQFFGMYSSKILILNVVYLVVFIFSISLFVYSKKNQKN